MVSIVTGNGVGLGKSSAEVLGQGGQLGLGQLPGVAGNAYVNAATGNLIIQRQDELLIGRGPDIGVYQTYNSQGTFDFDNNDNWQVSLYRQLSGLTGTVNTAGSTVTRTGADGTQLIYTYDSTAGSATLGKYVNKDGSGSYDTLTYTTGTNTWVWQDGDTRIKESYAVDPNDSTKWRITSVTDLDNNSLTYTYSTTTGLTGLIDKVTSANGEITQLIYNSSKQLTQINVINSSSVTTTRIRYTYESTAPTARLTSVSTDLTPADGSIVDGKTYTTTYTYDGNSNRIASITNSDGSKVSFTYEQSGLFRLLTISDYVTNSSTINNTTTLNYTSATTTTVTNTNNAGTSLLTTLTYDATSKQLTNVQGPSGSGQNVSYTYNANGDVTQVTDSRGDWTKYTYDSQGNQLTQQDNLGNTIVRTYDSTATGFNQLLTETVYTGVDATPGDATVAGTGTAQTTRYTYDSKNHVRFTISPEGRVTEYRYNATNGQLTSTHQYTDNLFTTTGNQTETQMNTWLTAAIKTKSQRTDYLYDARGQLSETVVYTKVNATAGSEGNGVADGSQMRTQYVYDQSGNLKQKIDARGVATTGTANDYMTSYSYDGLNRLTLTKQYDQSGLEANAVSTSVTYTDASRQVKLTLANGLVTTSTYDLAGRLISVQKSDSVSTTVGSLGTTSYAYDKLGNLRMVTDPAGQNTYYLYDSANRKVGEIDPNKNLTEWVYNNNGQVIRTIQYKNAVTATLNATTALTNTMATAGVRPAADATNDRTAYRVYDQAGRLSHEIDALGYVTEYQYDGASRLLRTLEYNTVISAANLALIQSSTTDVYGINGSIKGISGIATTNTLTLTADATNDRANRNLYDNDGKLVGSLDAEGYLTEYVYDKAGRQTQKIRYATVTSSANWGTGDLATLRGNATNVPADTAKHQTTNYIYDAAGQLIGEVDAENYLTEYQYDLVGNKTQQIRYATSITYVAGNTVVQSRPASNNEDQKITNTYDANNRILSTLSNTQGQVNGLLTNYTYDNVGNLTQTVNTFTGATSAQERAQRRQYDSRGNLIAELSGEGVVALLALGSTPTQAQKDAVWNSYGTRYSYDTAGRLISKITPNGIYSSTATASYGNKTLYYYDKEGKLTYTVNALGEVAQTVYNSFDQVAETRRYNTRIAAATLAGLVGGDDSAMTAVITGIGATNFSNIQLGYDKRGQVVSTTDELTNVNSRTYNAFGELNNRTDKIDGSSNIITSYQYDRKGLLKATTEDAAGINRITSAIYDAFGRVTQTTDGRNNTQKYQYDRLGREVTTTDGLNRNITTTYDAFSRLLKRIDRNNNTAGTTSGVTYSYNAVTRTMTMTTAEGVVVETVKNQFGDTVSVKDGRGSIATYQYNANGQLTQTVEDSGSGKLNITTSTIYDTAGRVDQTSDARGTLNRYTYDAADRVLRKRIQDVDDDYDFSYRYRYDAQGRQVWEQDVNGVWTRIDYDAKGQVTSITVDPKKTADWVSGGDDNPNGLNLTTSYTYNVRGKKMTVTEGAGTASARITQYVYDKLGRLTSSIVDPGAGKLNLTTTYAYDKNDNVVLKTDANNNKTVYTYDANNRLVYTVDAMGYITKNEYDANGNIVKVREYKTGLAAATLTTLQGAPTSTTITPTELGDDRVTRYGYDKDNRLTYITDAEWLVTRNEYDANGNVVRLTRYASVASAVSDTGGAPTVGTHAADRVTQTVYDAMNRATYTIDAEKYVTRLEYDVSGNVIKKTRYATALASLPAVGVAPSPTVSGNDQVTDYYYDGVNRVILETRASGSAEAVTTSYEYDALGNQISITEAPGTASARTTQQRFDAVGRKTEVIDANGKSTKTEYNAAGDIVKVIDALGNVGYFYTDAAGRITLQVDPEGAVTQTQYDGLGNATQVLRFANKVQTSGTGVLSTGASIQVVSSAPGGNSVYVLTDTAKDQKQTIEYDKLGQKLTVKTWTGLTSGSAATDYYSEGYTYTAFGDVETQTARNGLVTTYTYDKQSRKKSESFAGITVRNAANNGTVTLKNSYTYNGFGDLVTKVEADGALTTRTTTYANDRLGRQVTATQSVQTTTGVSASAISQKTYDARGNLIAERDVNSNWTYTYYDKQDRRTASVKADGSYTTWTYDALGNISQQTQYANKVQVSGTDTLSATSSIQLVTTAPGGNAVYLLTDAANDRTTLYTYDKVGRQTGTEIQNITTGSYNTASSQYQVSTGSITTKTEYDALGNIIKQTDGNGNVTRSWYNKTGQIVAKLDAENYLTVWTRDVYGNITQETRYANKVQTVGTATYTDSGAPEILTTTPTGNRVYVLTDSTNDRTTVINYDKLNRVSSETVNNVQAGSVNATTGVLTNPTAVNATTSYQYDGLNNITQKTDATSAITNWVYDGLGRELSEINPQFVDYQNNTVRSRTDKEYDGLNNVTREIRRGTDNTAAATISGQVETDDQITTYTYGVGGRLTSEKDATNAEIQYEYDLNGNITKQTLKDRRTIDQVINNQVGVDDITTYTYDSLNRQTKTTDLGTTVVQEVQYNSFDQIAQKRTYTTSVTPTTWDEYSQYDRAGRVWKSNSGDGVTKVTISDKNGNATLKITPNASNEYKLLSATGANIANDITISANNTSGGITASAAIILMKSVSGVSPQSYTFTGNQSALFEPGLVLKSNIYLNSTGDAGRRLGFGLTNAVSGSALRRHTAYVQGNDIYADWYDPTTQEYKRELLGSKSALITPSTMSYLTIEVEATTTGTILYVYQRDSGRESGFKHQLDIDGWGGNVQALGYTYGDTTLPAGDSGAIYGFEFRKKQQFSITEADLSTVLQSRDWNWEVQQFDKRNQLSYTYTPNIHQVGETRGVGANTLGSNIYIDDKLTIQLGNSAVIESTVNEEGLLDQKPYSSLTQMQINGSVAGSNANNVSKTITIYKTNSIFNTNALNWPIDSLTGFGPYAEGLGLYGPGIVRMVFKVNGSSSVAATIDWGTNSPEAQQVSLGTTPLSTIHMTLQKQIAADEWVEIAPSLLIWDTSKGSNFASSSPVIGRGTLLSYKNGAYSTSNYWGIYQLPASIVFANLPPKATRVLIYYKSAASANAAAPYQIAEASPMKNVGGNNIDGYFAWQVPAVQTPPLPNIKYEYIVLDADNNVLSHRTGTYVRAQSPTFSILSLGNPKAVAVGGTGFGIANSTALEILDQSVAASLKVRYRIKGTATAWSEKLLNPGVLAGEVTNGYFALSYGADFIAGNAYELDIEAYDQSGSLINHVRTALTRNTDNTNLVEKFVHFEAMQSTVRFDASADVSTMQVQYRLAGSNTAFSSILLSNGSNGFYWDTLDLSPNLASNYDYEIIVTALNSSNQAIHVTNATIRLGGDTRVLSANTDTANAELNWVLRDIWKDAGWTSKGKLYNAFGGVARETDALGHETDFIYNTLGRLVEQKSPETDVTLANGFIQRQRPTTKYIYDAVGRLIATTDANNNTNTLALISIAGDDVARLERHADGGIKTYGYDVFGDKRYEIDEALRKTDYTYNANHQIVRVDRQQRVDGSPGDNNPSAGAATRGYDEYVYDAAGNRISHKNSLGNIEKIYYDSLSRVIKQTTYLGANTQYQYTYLTGLTGLGGNNVNGWQVLTTQADGRTTVDRKDMFERLLWSKDLGDHVFTYRYGYAGKLTSQTSLVSNALPTGVSYASAGAIKSGQNIAYSYNIDGSIKRIDDYGIGAQTLYDYDKEGNRIAEAYLKGAVRTDATISYDELNRVTSIVDARASIQYEYDAIGNKRHMLSNYKINSVQTTQDYWYTYDSMNRFTTSMGSLGLASNGAFTTTRGGSASDDSVLINKGVNGGAGVSISYNLAGERVGVENAVDGTLENYTYTADGYLEDVKINSVLRSRRVNDALGRVTNYYEYNTSGSQVYNRINTYDSDNRLLSESGVDSTSGTAKSYSNTYYFYASRNADGSDSSSSVSQAGFGALARIYNNNAGVTLNTWYSYEYWDDAKKTAITAQAYDPAVGQNNKYWKPGYSDITYNVNGHIKQAQDTVGNRTLSYITDANGIILRREENSGGVLYQTRDSLYQLYTTRVGGTTTQQRYYYYNGVRVGDIGDADPSRVDYAQALAGRTTDKKDYKDVKPITSADFDQSYEPIGPNNPGFSAEAYTVRSGDTLQSIASTVWGDSSMWYLIADANGLTNGSALTAGQSLTIPNKVTNIHNNTSTFKVYNPNEALGDLTPTIPDTIELPPPPPPKKKKKKCGGLGGIISAIVTIVVTVVAWPLGPVVAAALGNIAGQVTANVMGVQKGFNFKSFATSVVTAGIINYTPVGGIISNLGNGVKTALGGLKYADVAVRAMAGNVVNQGVGNITGSQKGFSWSSVAIAGVGSAAAAYATNKMGLTNFNAKDELEPVDTKLGTDLGRVAVNAGVSALTQLVVKGGKINWQQVATDTLINLIQDRADRYLVDKSAELVTPKDSSSPNKGTFTGERINIAGGRGRTDVPVIDLNTATAGSGTSEDPLYWENTPDFKIRASDSDDNASPGISFEFIKETQDALDAKAAANWQRAMSSLGDMGESSLVDGYYAQHGYPRLQGTSNIGRNTFNGIVDTVLEPFRLIDDGMAYAFGQKREVISGRFIADSATIQAFQTDGIDALWKVPLRAVTDVVNSPVRLFDGYVRGDAEQIGNAGATFLGTISGGGLSRLGKAGGVETAANSWSKKPKFFTSETVWTAPNKGTGNQYKVFQQNIDFNLVVKDGYTNLDLMKKGNAPYIMKNGRLEQLQLHHSRQNGQGPLFELSKSTHLQTKSGQGYEALHPYGRQQHPDFPVNRQAFDNYDKRQYWIDRTKGYQQ